MINAAPPMARAPRWTRCQSVAKPSTLAYWHMGRGTFKRGDLWDRRLKKRKAKFKKFKDEYDTAADKKAYADKYTDELVEHRRLGRLQGRLNKFRKMINKLKSLESTAGNAEKIRELEAQRTEMIKEHLSKTEK